METEKVYAMPFAKIYPILVAKAVGKGRTQAEVDEIIGWLTGYSAPQIEAAVQNGTLYGDFFETTLYGKDKHDERSGYYETPCRLRQRL